MTDKLSVWNGALVMIGERTLASLTENREPRRVLDTVWPMALRYVLEQGFWNFAMRSAAIEYDPNISPSFGYSFAFEKPSDWIRTAALSAEATFRDPLRDYVDEAGYWWSNTDPIYVRYVSDDIQYGGDLSRWPATFHRYVESHLASLLCERLTQNSSKLDDLRKIERARLTDARSKDAMADPPGVMPLGQWVRARRVSTNLKR